MDVLEVLVQISSLGELQTTVVAFEGSLAIVNSNMVLNVKKSREHFMAA